MKEFRVHEEGAYTPLTPLSTMVPGFMFLFLETWTESVAQNLNEKVINRPPRKWSKLKKLAWHGVVSYTVIINTRNTRKNELGDAHPRMIF